MRLFILLWSAAFGISEFYMGGQFEDIRWGDWSEWSACTNPCGEDGTRLRTRPCLGGNAGSGACQGDTNQKVKCTADCTEPCASNVYYLNSGVSTTVPLSAPAVELCFWSEATTDGVLLTYNNVVLARESGFLTMRLNGGQQVISINRDYAHTCIIFNEDAEANQLVKIVQDGDEFGWYGGGASVKSLELYIGGGLAIGGVYQLSAKAELGVEAELLRTAQAHGSACNMGSLIDESNADGFLINSFAWSEWAGCSHNCNGGRSYRYRNSDDGRTQMWRSCNVEPCAPGWEDWSHWTPCDSSCGAGTSHRSRRWIGGAVLEGVPLEARPCEGLPCPQCGYSNWQFPEEQSTTNYLMIKHVIPNMASASICFSIQDAGSQLLGTVLSYSKGLDSPRGNELLFLGKDITNDEIRLYRRDNKLSIPNDVLSTDGPTHFCIVLQAQPNEKIFTSIYVNGIIMNTSTDGIAKDGIALSGGGEMIIGQDQDCLLGCFNASQAFVGNLDAFAIYDVALDPNEVYSLATENDCGERSPVLTLSQDAVIVYGKVEFTSKWGEWTDWIGCSADCGSGRTSRFRSCLGGQVNGLDCPGPEREDSDCTNANACEIKSDSWSECSVKCGGIGTQSKLDENNELLTQECGNKPCQDYGQWSSWSECSVSCGEGFIYRARECFNGPCEELTQETSWCDNGGVSGRCADPWNLSWPCGEGLEEQKTRIVGGYEARRAEIPWICLLEVRSDPICGASIIAPRWNIGASHCVSQTYDLPDQMRMLCGKHDRTHTEIGSQIGTVKAFYKHPKYSGQTIDYDLCLFELRTPWKFTDYVKPACLPGLHKFPLPGSICKVAGWGSTLQVRPGVFHWDITMAKMLRVVKVPIIEQAQCAAKYKDQVSRRMFCAGYSEGGRDACQGDSGGPLSCQVGTEGKFQITGVVSWGIGCAQENLPGVYTKIAMLTDWIYDYIGSDVGRDPACNAEPLEKYGPRGNFASPGFDGGTPYKYNMNCHWVIGLRPLRGLLAVTFHLFDLQYSKDCREDSLSIYDGENLDRYKGAWCGPSGPSTMVSENTEGKLKFVMTTNADNRGTMPKGFKAVFARAKLRTTRAAGCGLPIEDFTETGKLRSAQSLSWPLTPPPNVPVSCMIVLRARKDRETKKMSFPIVMMDEPIEPWCAGKIKFFRTTKTADKYGLKTNDYNTIISGQIFKSEKPIVMMLIDKDGGNKCRWKLHFTGCGKKSSCNDIFKGLTVPERVGRRVDQFRAGGQNSERSCSLNGFKNPTNQIGLSQNVNPWMKTSLVQIIIPKPTGNSGGNSGKNNGKNGKKRSKRDQNSKVPLVCSGGLIGNDRCFVTSEECAKVIKRNWDDKNGLVNDPVYAKVGGELIMTNNCVMSPKVGDGDSIAVCGLGAAVNPQTVLVPCYPDSEVQSGEVLLSESQTNLNNGKMEEKFQSTWLPTHNDIGFKFMTGFSGSGQTLCSSESGSPIYREGDIRELIGINLSSNMKCGASLSFGNTIRHASWIAQECAKFETEESNFDVLKSPEESCPEEPVEIKLGEDCIKNKIDFSSYNHPELYENSQNCKWNIVAPKGHQVLMEFVDVDIERSNHKRKCTHDVLLWKIEGRPNIEICSSQPVRLKYISPKDSVSLEFISDDSFKGRGFKAELSCQRKAPMNKNRG